MSLRLKGGTFLAYSHTLVSTCALSGCRRGKWRRASSPICIGWFSGYSYWFVFWWFNLVSRRGKWFLVFISSQRRSGS